MAGLQIRQVYKSFGSVQAVAGISLEAEPGEIMAVLGPSGCGKSTLLLIVAGLEQPDRGDVLWDGSSILSLPVHARGFGLMFQDYALFPHLNVYDNVAFGLRMAGLPAEQVQSKVKEALDLVGLPGFDRRDVNTLSGGEQQRVALARSLAPRPPLLMLDEPLGALDRSLRERLLVDLKKILGSIHQTTLYVTHDQEEAFALADRVAVMNAGRLEQVDAPLAVFRSPASLFVARFLGFTNLIEGQAYAVDGRTVAETPLGELPLAGPHRGPVTLLLRPDGASLSGEGRLRLCGRVQQRSFRGATCLLDVVVDEVRLRFEFASTLDLPQTGESVCLRLDPDGAIQVFPRP